MSFTNNINNKQWSHYLCPIASPILNSMMDGWDEDILQIKIQQGALYLDDLDCFALGIDK